MEFIFILQTARANGYSMRHMKLVWIWYAVVPQFAFIDVYNSGHIGLWEMPILFYLFIYSIYSIVDLSICSYLLCNVIFVTGLYDISAD